MPAEYERDHWSFAAPDDDVLAEYVAHNLTPYNRTKSEAFGRVLPADLRGAEVLDYGGGAGWMAIECAARGAKVTVVDASANALRLARRFAEQRGVAGAIDTWCARELPPAVAARRFDVVIAKDIIEHVPRDGDLMAAFAACHKPGGLLVLSTHNAASLNFLIEGAYRRWWRGERDWYGWDPTHVRFYTPGSLRRLLRAAGYRAQSWFGVYVVPYDILTWALLLRRRIVVDHLSLVDRWFGGTFPLNRLGWNVVVAARRGA